MRLPPGSDPDRAALGYYTALQGFTIESIGQGIRDFLRGNCPDVSMKFCPHPPELASIIRKTIPSGPVSTGKFYAYRQPKSKVIERKIGKEYARQLVDVGVHPRGCIWLPGDPQDKPEIGDLFAPDPEWKRPTPLNEKDVA
jgi:hypothetical protein